MKLDPYVQVGDTPFTASREDLLRARGEPWRAQRNGVGLNEMDYGDVVYRFQDCGRLEEITLQAEVVHIGKVAVPEGAGYGLSPYFRVSFATSLDKLVEACRRMDAAARKLR